MGDGSINITVGVKNIQTLDDARGELKSLKKELGAVALDNIPRQKQLGAEIVKVKGIIADATASTVTANGKMMKSYFQTGEELRRFYRSQLVGDRTMRETTQTVQTFGAMLGGEGLGKVVGTAIGGFQQMEFATNAAGIAAVGAGGKYATFGQTLIGLAAPMAAAAGAFALIAMAANEAKKITEGLNAAIKESFELSVAGGRVSKEEQVRALTAQINRLSGKPLEGPSAMAALLGPQKVMEERATFAIKRENEIQALMNKRLAIEKELTAEQKKQDDEQKKSDKDDFAKFQLMANMMKSNRDTRVLAESRFGMRKVGIGGMEERIPKFETPAQKKARERGGMGIGTENIGGPVPMGPKQAIKQIGLTFGEIMQQSRAFESVMLSSVGTIAGSISSGIGGAFARVFGGAQTMLGQLAGNAATILGDLAVRAGLSRIPGLGFLAPFMAGGGPVSSGRPYIVGEKGPELFVPNRGGSIVSNAKAARFSGGSMGGMQTVQVVGVLHGNDMRLMNAKSNLARRGRLM